MDIVHLYILESCKNITKNITVIVHSLTEYQIVCLMVICQIHRWAKKN
jgi:hypothetical protein